jgi:hypothetical protein
MQPDPTHLLQFTLIVALFISIVNGVASIYSVFGGRKQKREVSFTFVPASKEEFDEHVRASKAAQEELSRRLEETAKYLAEKSEAKTQELRHEMVATTHAIHERINEVLATVSELRGELKRLK